MQNTAQRREASLQHYREQYDSAHPPQPQSSSSSSSRPVNSRYTDGEDEIDSGGVDVCKHRDEVDSTRNCLTQADTSSPSADHM